MSEPVKPLGVTDAGGRFLAGLAVADARFHLHVPGVTGTGKTTLLANMVLADARAGRGAGPGDGLTLQPATLPGSLDAFVDHVVPILQQRGLHRTGYTATTLRGHLAQR